MTETIRLTVAQALIKFLACQYSERDGDQQRLIAGCFGIFGHGNVAGVGQALLESELDDPATMPYILGRNEQAMVHTASAYARTTRRTQTYAVTSSIGPGATNMITGAASATINRLPVLLLPSDGFATRAASPLLQELEQPGVGDVSVNDAFRPVSRYFDRIQRPGQLPPALLSAMRVLTDVAETGAVTLCMPQDVQAEAYDWPVELFARRVWHIDRPQPEPQLLERAADLIRAADRPMIIAGGGVRYSRAEPILDELAVQTGLPVAQTQAGKATLTDDRPQCLGAVGATGTTAANAIAAEADLVVGIGTRYSDFTTASRTAFTDPDVAFININVTGMDAVKESGLAILADARDSLILLGQQLDGYRVADSYASRIANLLTQWTTIVDDACRLPASAAGADSLLSQSQLIGAVNQCSAPGDVVVCAAGSMPGDLHKLWRSRDHDDYHVEYGYSCMGYEIAAGIGVAMAAPDPDVFVLVGDGSYLMMPGELVTAVQEDIKIIVVLVQNHGFASIGSLSESLGSQRFGTRYRRRTSSGRLDGDLLPVDLAANAASFGLDVIRANTAEDVRAAIAAAKQAQHSTVIHVETDPSIDAPDSGAWWDVPVSQAAALDSTRQAYQTYEQHKATQRTHLDPTS
jgi:3D-(3,5/4)-trihydroxycyclohexane-1,2-dione acylhydrolase (decyclizing)